MHCVVSVFDHELQLYASSLDSAASARWLVAVAASYGPAKELGRRVRELRQEHGWSQMELAELATMHFTYVASVERGERNLSLRSLLRIAAALGVDPGHLVAGLTP